MVIAVLKTLLKANEPLNMDDNCGACLPDDGVIIGFNNNNSNNLQVLPANARYLLGVSYPSSER